jgi:cytochrome c553
MKPTPIRSILFVLVAALPLTGVAGDPAAGKAKAAVCAACHGPDGNSPTAPMYPKLAGQYEDYLYQALKEYKSQARANAIMQGQVATLSDRDLRDLAAYYASLSGDLHTAKPE